MYASVHTDRSGRVFVSADHAAAAMAGTAPVRLTEAVALPEGAELIPLQREAIGYDRGGRGRPLGKGRLALAAIVPACTRLAFPAYVDDPAAQALEPRPYAAVGADARGGLVVAVVERPGRMSAAFTAGTPPIRDHPANALARQLTRCARDHACAAARAGLGRGDLPVPLGAPAAERPRLPVELRSGYAGAPTERAAFKPTVREIADVAAAHLDRGGNGVSFGRACDGEPLARVRVLEQAIGAIHDRAPRAAIHLETCGSDPVALRRAAEAGLTSIAVRLASARAGTYDAIHGPLAHRWADVRASLEVAVERRVALTVALLLLPGVTDRPAEIDAIVELLGDLPGGRLELRDLGADPLRVVGAVAGRSPLGMRALLDRLAEADHFRADVPLAEATV
jgi:hypothetical protein